MSGLFGYYKTVVRPLLILKYNYCDINAVPKITNIKIDLILNNIQSEEDWRIPMSLKFLQQITGRKAVIKKLDWSQGGGKERRLGLVSSVTLRKYFAYDFLEYLIFIVFPLYCRRYGWPSLEVSETGVYNCVFKDLSIFYRQKEDLTGFNGIIHLSIKTTSKNKEEGLCLLRNLGIPVLDK